MENDTTTTTFDDNPDPPPPPLPPEERPAPVRRLRRAPDSPLGGVATGIANYFDIAPIVVQVAFVASAAIGGFGALAYIACWFLIPTPSDPETRPITITANTTRAVFGVLFAIGAASSTLTLGPGTFEITLVPLLLIAAGFYLLNQRERNGEPDAAPDREPGAVRPETGEPSHWAAVTPDVGPVEVFPPEPPRPPVTSVTLAVAVVAVGLLLTISQFGPTIPAAAVLGAALAVVGAGLVYGAFRGRGRGLVPIGLILILALVASPTFDALADGGTGDREYTPLTEADVRDSYDLGAGPLELDLRRVSFTEDRTIDVTVGAGYAEIWVPRDVDVRVVAETSAGYVDLFGREQSGIMADATASRSAEVDPTRSDTVSPSDPPTITVNVDVTFGYVEVRRG